MIQNRFSEIKLFKMDGLPYTPFDLNFSSAEYEYLFQNGLSLTHSIKEADILIASSFKSILNKPTALLSLKPILIWTNEPRVSTATCNFDPWIKIFQPIHFLNIYSGKVFISNITYQSKRFLNSSKLSYVKKEQLSINRIMIALMSFYKGPSGNDLKIRGVDLDLLNQRNKIALYGYSKGIIDIFGKGWPQNISQEDSREGNWGDRKRYLLSKYSFNLAFENTVFPYYITEKIWDSIENYCLPVYFGGPPSTIYESFPKGSFLDYSKIKTPEILFKTLTEMTVDEFSSRLNKCIKVYNHYVEKPEEYWNQITRKRLDHIVTECRNLVSR